MTTHSTTTERFRCQICGHEKRKSEVLPADLVRPAVVETIRRRYPDWSPSGFICWPDLRQLRRQYVEDIMAEEKGQLSDLEHEVVRSLEEHELIAKNINVEFDQELTVGERVADHVAEFGGSWKFIILFGTVLAAWIVVNTLTLLARPFDPYPYILLNLVLSCIAAIQAPVIMMSQNRQETKDRLRAEHDYQVNLKAELEIRHLNGKMDLLLTHQWDRLLQLQQIQLDLMEEIARHGRAH
jgi:uncharacterized membrane protein